MPQFIIAEYLVPRFDQCCICGSAETLRFRDSELRGPLCDECAYHDASADMLLEKLSFERPTRKLKKNSKYLT